MSTTPKLRVFGIDGIVPVVHPSAFVHPSAILIGDVIVGARCYVGPCASLRGDFGRLILEEGVNVQDTCVMHGFPGTDTIVESNGHIGHGAVLHGCTVKANALVGMNAVVMDNAVIGESSFVAASSFVKAGMEVPPRTLVAGIPAKIVRQLSDDELLWKQKGTAGYQQLTRRCLATMIETDPITRVEPNRPRVDMYKNVPLDVLKVQLGLGRD